MAVQRKIWSGFGSPFSMIAAELTIACKMLFAALLITLRCLIHRAAFHRPIFLTTESHQAFQRVLTLS